MSVARELPPQKLAEPVLAIRHLSLTQFRSYPQLELPITGGLVAISGANGRGKTNLLEAISLLYLSRGLRYAPSDALPHRTKADTPAPLWAVGAELATATGTQQLGTGNTQGQRQYRLNTAPSTAQEVSALIPQLWLTPASERFFGEEKQTRRQFLDRFAGLLQSSYALHARHYEKAQRERLRVLQHGSGDATWLAGLEQEMAEHGVAVAQARLQALDAMTRGIAQFSFDVFPRAELHLFGTLETALRSQEARAVQSDFANMLAQGREQDRHSGRTQTGPHRSDLQLHHRASDTPAALCSTGEQKALLIGVILAQAAILRDRLGVPPLLLLDEVLVHLDKKRRAVLVKLLDSLGCQAWITANDRADFAIFAKSQLGLQNHHISAQ